MGATNSTNVVDTSEAYDTNDLIRDIETRTYKGLENNETSLRINEHILFRMPEVIFTIITLTSLDLSTNNIKRIPQDLSKLINLSKLKLSNNIIERIIEFPHLPKLKTLEINNNCFIEQPIFSTFPKSLTSLDISSCRLIHLTGIEELQNLKILHCSNNEISNFECISKLINLEKLFSQKTNFVTINGIHKLKQLKVLDLTGNYKLLEIPSKIDKLKELECLFIASTQIYCLPKSLESLENLTSLNISWNMKNNLLVSNSSISKIFLNLTANEYFTMIDIFPNLNDEMIERERLLDALYPPLQLGFLPFLKKLIVETSFGSLHLFKENHLWKYVNTINHELDVQDEFQSMDYQQGNFIFGANGIFLFLPRQFSLLLNHKSFSSVLTNNDVVSYFNFDDLFWIIDCENNVWYCDLYSNSFSLLPHLPPIIKIISCFNNILLLDNNQNIWKIEKENDIQATKTNLPKFKNIFSITHSFLGICDDSKLWNIKFELNGDFFYERLLDLDHENIPSIQYILTTGLSIRTTNELLILDNNHKLWIISYIIRKNSNSTSNNNAITIKNIIFDENIVYLESRNSIIYFITESKLIYGCGYYYGNQNLMQGDLPLLLPFKYPQLNSRQKSARK